MKESGIEPDLQCYNGVVRAIPLLLLVTAVTAYTYVCTSNRAQSVNNAKNG